MFERKSFQRGVYVRAKSSAICWYDWCGHRLTIREISLSKSVIICKVYMFHIILNYYCCIHSTYFYLYYIFFVLSLLCFSVVNYCAKLIILFYCDGTVRSRGYKRLDAPAPRSSFFHFFSFLFICVSLSWCTSFKFL